MPCEGGHAGFAPYDGVEAAIWASLRRTYGRVSIERILSGPGLYALYRGLADVRGVPAELKDEKEVLAAGQKGGDLLAEETLCLLYTSPSPRDGLLSRMPSSA